MADAPVGTEPAVVEEPASRAVVTPSAPATGTSSRWPLIVTALVLVTLAVAGSWADVSDRGDMISLFTKIVVFGLAAMSLDLIVGYGGMVSLGHAAFFGLGSYTAGALAFHAVDDSTVFGIGGTEQALISWPLAMVLGALLGLLIGGLSLRTKGVYFIMATLAFNQMVFFLFNALEIYGGDDGVGIFSATRRIGPLDADDDATYFWVCFVVLVAAVIGLNFVIRSPFGRVLRGCHDNEGRMRALGYATYRYRLVAFALAASLAGLAGAMNVGDTQFLNPGPAHWTESGELLIMVIAGGLGSLIGGVIGAGVLLVLEELAIDYTDNVQFFIGAALLVVVLVAPRGVAGLVFRRHRNV